MSKKYRTVGQIENLLKEYEDEILKVKRMLETETDEKTRRLLQEGLAENMTAKKNLERYLNDNDVFK